MNKLRKYIENNKKLVIILFFFITSQFLFFGWALGKFIEPDQYPFKKTDAPIDTGPAFQVKKGTLNIGGISLKSENNGGYIYFSDGRFIGAEGGSNSLLFSGKNKNNLIVGENNGQLKLSFLNNSFYLGGSQIQIAGQKIPPIGSLCGMARFTYYGGGLWKDLMPCNLVWILGKTQKENGIGLVSSKGGPFCPDGYEPKILMGSSIMSCVYTGEFTGEEIRSFKNQSSF